MQVEEVKKFFTEKWKEILGVAGVSLVTTFLGYNLFKKSYPNSLKGKTNLGVAITGGSKGIGFEMAKIFLEKGHRVVICSRDQENLDVAAKQLNSDKLFVYKCDVSKAEEAKNFVSYCVEKLTVIDVFINNAGIPAGLTSFETLETKKMENCVNVNILGSMYCSKYALEVLKSQKNGGHLFVTEGFGSAGYTRPGLTTYGSTKYCTVFLGRSLAHECVGTNVGVHRLYPGLTLTDFITNGKETLPKEMAYMMNVIGDTPDNVAKNLVPRILSIEGNDKHLEYVTQLQYTFRFLTASFRSNRFFDKDGKRIN